MASLGARLVCAAPPEQLGPPGQIRVGGPQLHVLVEHLATVQRAILKRLAAVQRGRPIGAERLPPHPERHDRRAMTNEPVLSAAVDEHARRIELVQPRGRAGAAHAQELRSDRADAWVLQPVARPRS